MENNIIDENTQIVSTDPERIHKVLIVTFETTKKRYYFEVLGDETYKKKWQGYRWNYKRNWVGYSF